MLNWSKLMELGAGGALAIILVYLLLQFVEKIFVKKNTSLEEKADATLAEVSECRRDIAVVKAANTEFKERAKQFYLHDWLPLVERMRVQDNKLTSLEIEAATLRTRVKSLATEVSKLRGVNSIVVEEAVE